ncbi:glycoside hydrolase family 43 protein [Georgenia deserti]|uniref:Glycoside hydrolase family 43 protein n=1 Tax=Georgenia deserti TaxID=2093781 RepID=A0ABW4L2Q5_9MICO
MTTRTDSPAKPARVWPENFADPAVLHAGGEWWAYATNGPRGNAPVLRSPDLRTWRPVGDALPELPGWAEEGFTWAPEVAATSTGYVMYYTARVRSTGLQGIGRAVASHPAGPYLDDSEEPLIFQADEGGSIDATPFTDTDGTRYLWWKNDGNAVEERTWLYAATLSDDGLALSGSPTRVVGSDLEWEGDLVEGPFLFRRGATLHLFYSANGFRSADYAVGHAVCDGPMGPCRKTPDPVLTGNPLMAGPGHCVVVEHEGRTLMIHHAWQPEDVGVWEQGRHMWVTELVWDGDRPRAVVPLSR